MRFGMGGKAKTIDHLWHELQEGSCRLERHKHKQSFALTRVVRAVWIGVRLGNLFLTEKEQELEVRESA